MMVMVFRAPALLRRGHDLCVLSAQEAAPALGPAQGAGRVEYVDY